ncbi:right-handed parallel beta-helix repeat-containing protein [Lachnobacterium bovis]|uniref:Right handed beta helix region n=1 Tax=Lachnobacterium bovis TaxID=140626 RepID=A0A1H9TYA1_9FIRM|nr:right-handed parallel beta-helix repeat-containing protein [Lachnobacterium bovis]SES01991.1 Right handed beta helix region [Lachnobacterium bovis]
MKYYVNGNVKRTGIGDEYAPFMTIQEAADVAKPGDEIYVYPGVYRESVNPVYSGEENKPIKYISVEKHKAIITGAERVKGWKALGNGVWERRINCEIFGDYNPYTTRVSGDWFIADFVAHTGDVYLNHKSMYEVTSEEDVKNPKLNPNSWDKEFSKYVWYAKEDKKNNQIVFLCNFDKVDPNEEIVEISVRKNCFFPKQIGKNYIHLSGFVIREAATQWAPPTAFQDGMIGPHWSKGWMIEDCDVYESKCVGISLGKYKQEDNDNKWLNWKYKDGAQTERECICEAVVNGWNKDNIGSHIVRNCKIHDCGQAGIVGHLGAVFSIIEDNEIYNINNKQNLAGAEIGGIKLHAAIDTIIRRNHIYNCTRGLWLDWQAQGTRVSQNLFHHNTLPKLEKIEKLNVAAFQGMGEDIFVEVSHGPTLIDNNVLLSDRAIKLASQGVAVVHNLIAGGLVSIGIGTDNGGVKLKDKTVRYTPYHMAHSTDIMGFMTILHGDDKFYNNIFIQQEKRAVMKNVMEELSKDGNRWDDGNINVGTDVFDNGFLSFDEWKHEFEGYCGMGSPDTDRYYMPLPVWTNGNVFLNGAKPWKKEKNYKVDSDKKYKLKLVSDENGWYLDTDIYDFVAEVKSNLVTTKTLGIAFEPEEQFENPNGEPLILDRDFYGNMREKSTIPGPFAFDKSEKTMLNLTNKIAIDTIKM